MKRLWVPALLSLLVGVLSAVDRPNIVLIISDDHGYKDYTHDIALQRPEEVRRLKAIQEKEWTLPYGTQTTR